jgi:hypothetical protein
MVEDPQNTEKKLTKKHQKILEISDRDPETPGYQSQVTASRDLNDREIVEEGAALKAAGVTATPAESREVSAPAASAQEQNRDQGQGRG